MEIRGFRGRCGQSCVMVALARRGLGCGSGGTVAARGQAREVPVALASVASTSRWYATNAGFEG